MKRLKEQIKLLVLDLDGTLVNTEKKLSSRTRQTLIKLQQQGVRLVLASGRPTYGIVPLAEELAIAEYGGFILSYNGGTIIDWSTKKVLHQSILAEKYISPCYELAQKHGVNIVSYLDEFVVTEKSDDDYVQYEAKLNNMPIKQVPDFCASLIEPVSKCLIVGDPAVLVTMEQQMKAMYESELSIYRSYPFFLEINPMDIDKANSLRILNQHLGTSPEQMVACGDGFNDLTMISYAGTGVAMLNAQEAVKKAASYVTGSNDDDGVAQFVESFLL